MEENQDLRDGQRKETYVVITHKEWLKKEEKNQKHVVSITQGKKGDTAILSSTSLN